VPSESSDINETGPDNGKTAETAGSLRGLFGSLGSEP